MRTDLKTTVLQFSKSHLHFNEVFLAVKLALVPNSIYVHQMLGQERVFIQHADQLVDLLHEVRLAIWKIGRIKVTGFFSERRRQDEVKFRI